MADVKGTPKEWVDKLLKVGVDKWTPPVRRNVPLSYSELITREQWATAYGDLLGHHNAETEVLFDVIRELVARLEKANA